MKSFYFILLLSFCKQSSTDFININTWLDVAYNREAFGRDAIDLIKNTILFIIDIVANYILSIIKSVRQLWNVALSADAVACLTDVFRFFIAERNGENWAFQVIDSFEKTVESGVIEGKPHVCVQSQYTPFQINNKTHYMKSHFCALRAHMSFNYTAYGSPEVGVCLPSSCKQDLVNVVLSSLRGLVPETSFTPEVKLVCYPVKIEEYFSDKFTFYCLMFTGILILIVIIGTASEIITDKSISFKNLYTTSNSLFSSKLNFCNKSKNVEEPFAIDDEIAEVEIIAPENAQHKKLGILSKILHCFSLYSNVPEMMSMEVRAKEISCLDGIRSLSLFWVIYGHMYIFGSMTMNDPGVFLQITETFSFNFVMGALSAVDTFFFLSGFLVGYIYMKSKIKQKSMSWIKFYAYTYIRMSPAYYFSVFVLYWGIVSKHKQNSYDMAATFGDKSCEGSWLSNLLYIQNYEKVQNMCNQITWYIGTAMQLFWISPIFLIALGRTKYFGAILCISVSVGCAAYSFWTAYAFNYIFYPKTVDIEFGENLLVHNPFDLMYVRPEYRIAPFTIGIFFGWLLIITNHRMNFSKIKVALLWGFVTICIAYPLFSPYYIHMETVFLSATYLALRAILWPLGVGLIIVLCCSDYGSIINSFLSWPVWIPISRISFCMYLTHQMVINFHNYSIGQLNHLTVKEAVMDLTVIIQVAFVTGALLYLLVDLPFSNLRKLFIN